jgi:hypothetical protein
MVLAPIAGMVLSPFFYLLDQSGLTAENEAEGVVQEGSQAELS